MADEKPVFAPYHSPAGGWGALHATAKALREQSIVLKGSKALLSMNQPDGFRLPRMRLARPRHTSSFEFCENGAKAVAFELTKRHVTREFFATHTVRNSTQQSDYWLEEQGRLTEPMRYDPNNRSLRPDQTGRGFRNGRPGTQCPGRVPTKPSSIPRAAHRTKSAFLYQLFVRRFGTNNFPDCSNMCHEPTSVGLPESIGDRQRHRASRGLRRTPTRSSSSDRTPAPTARG